MIRDVEINNFKSVKHLSLDCKRINLFIGEPNTGKSNILETLGVFSFGCCVGGYEGNIQNFVRFERMSHLFYYENLEDNIHIIFDDKDLEIKFEEGKFNGRGCDPDKEIFAFTYDYDGRGSTSHSNPLPFRFYRFALRKDFKTKKPDYLLPPFGENLLTVLLTHKELRSTVSQIFTPFGLQLIFRPYEDKIEVWKPFEDENIIVTLPYSLVSDTFQRIIFYLAAIHSNKDAILVFEEPESHAFPYYTKYLAEIIALDKNNNQYFISTHNPYLLLSILEKSSKDDVGIFITYFENYQTKVKPLSEKEKEEIMEMEIDIFFNIERFLAKR